MLLVLSELHSPALRFVLIFVAFIVFPVSILKPNSVWELNTAKVQVMRPVSFSHNFFFRGKKNQVSGRN